MKEDKSITITLSPEVYRDLRNSAVIRYMDGSADQNLADAFLVKLCRLIDKGADKYRFQYDPNEKNAG